MKKKKSNLYGVESKMVECYFCRGKIKFHSWGWKAWFLNFSSCQRSVSQIIHLIDLFDFYFEAVRWIKFISTVSSNELFIVGYFYANKGFLTMSDFILNNKKHEFKHSCSSLWFLPVEPPHSHIRNVVTHQSRNCPTHLFDFEE